MAKFTPYYKVIFSSILYLVPLVILGACTTNLATGEKQFTPFMPASAEAQIGATEHEKIIKEYGGTIKNSALQAYVTNVGKKLVPHTERKDVTYTFTVLDSPVVNAFALPGGYVYITRGILALANDEAELAAVMGHEMGHVTARHSAERYSASILTGIGATIISAAVKTPGLDQAVGLGANLYLSSYSRSQEHQADDLGVRYISRAGYDPRAMSRFLRSLEASAALDAKIAGRDDADKQPSYFSTHPVTSDRISASSNAATQYAQSNMNNRDAYMRAISGMQMGDSADQGFMAAGMFVHPAIGFKFEIPKDFATQNTPSRFIATSKRKNGPAIIFSGGAKPTSQNITDYLTKTVLKGDLSTAKDLTTTNVNGMPAASVEIPGTVNGVKSTIRAMVIEWDKGSVFRFDIAMPAGTTNAEQRALKNSVFSFARLTSADKKRYKPKQILTFAAKPGDSAGARAASLPYDDDFNLERFRVYNGLSANDTLVAGQRYKTIVQ